MNFSKEFEQSLPFAAKVIEQIFSVSLFGVLTLPFRHRNRSSGTISDLGFHHVFDGESAK